MYWLPYSSHHSSQTPSLPWIHSKTDARFMQDAPKAVWSIPYISVTFFPSLKQNFIANCSSKVFSRPDCIFESHQLCQSGFSRVYSNSCCSCSFESEIIKIGQSSHKMYSNKTLNFQETRTVLNACTKILESTAPRISNNWKSYIWGELCFCPCFPSTTRRSVIIINIAAAAPWK